MKNGGKICICEEKSLEGLAFIVTKCLPLLLLPLKSIHSVPRIVALLNAHAWGRAWGYAVIHGSPSRF